MQPIGYDGVGHSWNKVIEIEQKMRRNNSLSLEDSQQMAVRTIRFHGASARQARIGQSLRTVYHEVAKLELPDDFSALIERLDEIDL
jgi:hypothetical protein